MNIDPHISIYLSIYIYIYIYIYTQPLHVFETWDYLRRSITSVSSTSSVPGWMNPLDSYMFKSLMLTIIQYYMQYLLIRISVEHSCESVIIYGYSLHQSWAMWSCHLAQIACLVAGLWLRGWLRRTGQTFASEPIQPMGHSDSRGGVSGYDRVNPEGLRRVNLGREIGRNAERWWTRSRFSKGDRR